MDENEVLLWEDYDKGYRGYWNYHMNCLIIRKIYQGGDKNKPYDNWKRCTAF